MLKLKVQLKSRRIFPDFEIHCGVRSSIHCGVRSSMTMPWFGLWAWHYHLTRVV
jgi:hypothetical protein